MVTTGILLSYFVNYAFADAGAWRWMLGAGMVPAVVLAIGILKMPESPRWLFEHGRKDEARAVLKRTRSGSVEEELGDIEETVETQSETGVRDLLAPCSAQRSWSGSDSPCSSRSPASTRSFTTPRRFSNPPLGNVASILATVGIGTINVVMTIVAILLVDRVGRRRLLLVGVGGMVATLAVLGTVFYLPGLGGGLGVIATISLMLFVSFFAIGLGPVFWLLISEIYPLSVRGSAMGVVTVATGVRISSCR